MLREDLKRLTLEQLKAEAARYGLPASKDKRKMIKSIMGHLERNALVEELIPIVVSDQASARDGTVEEGNEES